MTSADLATPSPLPPAVDALIKKVVARTRLRKSERADISRELAAHFRDGLQAGRSEVDLIESFGDPLEVAARLRTGAMAKRGAVDRALRQVRIAAGWTLAMICTLYLFGAAYLWYAKPVISFDPIVEFTSTIPRGSSDQYAWPLYKQGLLALADPLGTPLKLGDTLSFEAFGKLEGTAMPFDDGWAQQREQFAQRRAGIDLLTRAGQLPMLGYFPECFPRDEDGDIFFVDPTVDRSANPDFPLFSLLLPHLSPLRSAARLLGSDALHALEAGDGAQFVADIGAILAIAKHSEEGNLLISQLVGTAIRTLAFQRVVMALEWHPDALTDGQLAQLAQMLRDVPPSAYEIDLDSEFLGIRDLVQRTYSDDGKGDGWFNPTHGMRLIEQLTPLTQPGVTGDESNHDLQEALGAALSPVGAVLVASRKETLDFCRNIFDESEAQSRLPLWQQDSSYEAKFEMEVSAGHLAKIKWMLPRLLLPATAKAGKVRRMSEAESIGAQVAIALTRYRREHGRWPLSLGELVPKYLQTVPVDPYTGEGLLYELSGDRVTIRCGAEPSRDKYLLQSLRNQRKEWFISGDGLARFRPPVAESEP